MARSIRSWCWRSCSGTLFIHSRISVSSSIVFGLSYNFLLIRLHSSHAYIVITSLLTKLTWPGNSKETLQSSNQAATCPPVYNARQRLHTAPFYCWASSRKAVYTNFYRFWFDPIGIWSRVQRFNSRRSIHLTIDRFLFTSAFSERLCFFC